MCGRAFLCGFKAQAAIEQPATTLAYSGVVPDSVTLTLMVETTPSASQAESRLSTFYALKGLRSFLGQAVFTPEL